MDPQTRQNRAAWQLARRQHSVISREQLLALGFGSDAIKHRVRTGRLHPRWRGVYAVGRPELTQHGLWMAAVLTCGPRAALSHSSAGALCRICPVGDRIEVTVPGPGTRLRPGILVHRADREVVRLDGIPVTTPACTLIDLATQLDDDDLEAAVNEADKRDLIDPEALRRALERLAGRHGVARLRALLDRRTFTLTDSELERRFRPLARAAGLPLPQTRADVNGFRVDFFWPELGLVVETDGLRYHRTPAQQARDRVRDQAHAAAGLTPLRFTRAQVRFDPDHVRATLAAVAARLAARSGG
jgi:very-short-patch-repair endonuclease